MIDRFHVAKQYRGELDKYRQKILKRQFNSEVQSRRITDHSLTVGIHKTFHNECQLIKIILRNDRRSLGRCGLRELRG